LLLRDRLGLWDLLLINYLLLGLNSISLLLDGLLLNELLLLKVLLLRNGLLGKHLGLLECGGGWVVGLIDVRLRF
jgi:hypothetical protein